MKDFLFFNYSWVANSTFYFESFRDRGHTIDIVDERNISGFVPKDKYKNVVLYLHEPWTIPITNRVIDNYCQDSFLIQHDDTDFEDVQVWSNRSPELVMQRELTAQTNNPWNCPVEPFHFPMPSLYDESLQNKTIDVCFLANMTNPRRLPFVKHTVELAHKSLRHLNWFLKVTPCSVQHPPDEFKQVINQSKIGLHYFGNSYDTHRIWQLASTRTAIVMPWMRNKSVDSDHMPFDEYCTIRDDFSDLEEKVVSLLDTGDWQRYADEGFRAYNDRHSPSKCFDYYYERVMSHAKS